jgi:hypothetical protein
VEQGGWLWEAVGAGGLVGGAGRLVGQGGWLVEQGGWWGKGGGCRRRRRARWSRCRCVAVQPPPALPCLASVL